MAGNVLDSLIVLLGLDNSGFKKGQKEVSDGLKKTGEDAEKARKKLEEEAKRQAEAFRKVRDSVLELAAAIVGTIAGIDFVKAITKSDVAVGNLGRNVNATTKEVSVLEGMFRHLGSSAAEADGFLSATNQILQEIRVTGTSKALQPFALAGLDTGKFRDAKDYFERLQMLAEAASKMDAPKARYLLGQIYSEDTVNAILQGADALKKLQKAQEELNFTTPKDTAAARERTGAWADFDRALESLGRTITTEFTPVIVGATQAFTWFFNELSHNAPAAIGLIGGLVSVIGLLKGYALVQWATKMGGAFGIIGTAAGTLIGRLSLVVATLTAIYEIWTLAKAVFDWYGATHREGIKLTPEAEARLAAGALNGAEDPFHSGGGSGGSGSRGMRNNNPGNLNFAGQPGATREAGSGRFAAFGSMADGLAAMDEQLLRYGARGTDTIASIVGKYAPAGDSNNVSAYIADLVSTTGYGANQHLNLSDADTMRSLMLAMTSHEGNRVSVADINAGMAMAQQRAGGGGGVNVTMGDVHMHTTASTIDGHAQDLSKGVRHYVLASQSNSGAN